MTFYTKMPLNRFYSETEHRTSRLIWILISDLLISTLAGSPDVALLDEPVDNPSDESNGSGEDWRVTVLEQIKQFSPKKFEIITSKRTDLGKTSSN